MIGKTIGQYQVIDKIGEGGMGTVFKAEDTTLHRLVALKTLSGHLTEDEEARERFTREAQSASSLNHPNITTVYEFLEDEDTRLICMEYVEGKTIRDMVESGVVSVRKAIDIIIQAAEALDAAHNKGILHRDVKSANIMVNMEGRVKVMDFGLAHLEEKSQLTRTGTTMGTLSYSSPEQISGRTVDRRSEIFSLGAVFYELLTGQLPFKASNEAEILFAIINNEPPRVSKLRDDVPELVEAVVSRMLEKDVDLRYPNCAELIDDLKAVQGEFETSTVSISTQISRRVEAGSRRTRIWGGIAAVAAVAGIILVGIFSAGDGGVPRIAVMPFEDVGPPVDSLFSIGITDDLIYRLGSLQGLEPISFTSVMKYRGRDTSPHDIGRELDADFILDGTIRWQRDPDGVRIRVTPRIVRTSDEAEIWSGQITENYDEAFRLQTSISTRVVEELNIELIDEEQEILESRLTDNTEALLAYQRGRDFARRHYIYDNSFAAVRAFQEAVDLDRDFALAWAELAKAHSFLNHMGYDWTSHRRALADAAAARALELDPDSPEVQSRIGLYQYWAHKNYDKALECFAVAEAGLPNDCETIQGISWILRRLGRFEEALDKQIEALRLDPLNANTAANIASTLWVLHRFESADEYCALAIQLDPTQIMPYTYKAFIQVMWRGAVEESREILVSAPEDIDPNLVWAWIMLELTEGNYQAAMERLDAWPSATIESQEVYASVSYFRALLYDLMGESELAQSEGDHAVIFLENRIEEEPRDPRPHMSLGQSYAFLGRKEEAIREGRLVVDELFPLSHDALQGAHFVLGLAYIYVMVDEYNLAIDQLEILLERPSYYTARYFLMDRILEPLRDNPRFQQLMERYR
ncbi:protein kinase [Gemmatimonadota bacterium]